jgi:two-component system sensor histidine kinase KdpD
VRDAGLGPQPGIGQYEVNAAAWIDVVTCLNVQHLESLRGAAQKLTGVAVRETVPDAFVAAADRLELLDVSPEALRERVSRSYPPGVAGRALAGYFRPENLAALSRLGRRWIREHRLGPAGGSSHT